MILELNVRLCLLLNESCNFKGATLIGCQEPSVNEFRGSPIELHAWTASSLTLNSLVLMLRQGYCQCGFLVQPPHQFQERAVGPGPKPGPSEPSPAPADSAESWHLACHRRWTAHCHKGVQVAVPQPPLELPDHPQSSSFWQNCQSWWAPLVFLTRKYLDNFGQDVTESLVRIWKALSVNDFQFWAKKKKKGKYKVQNAGYGSDGKFLCCFFRLPRDRICICHYQRRSDPRCGSFLLRGGHWDVHMRLSPPRSWRTRLALGGLQWQCGFWPDVQPWVCGLQWEGQRSALPHEPAQ